jgi:hypothetical protein
VAFPVQARLVDCPVAASAAEDLVTFDVVEPLKTCGGSAVESSIMVICLLICLPTPSDLRFRIRVINA